MSVGLLGSSRKENEFRLPVHPQHFESIPADLRRHIFVEEGYARRFGTTTEQLQSRFAGVRPQRALFDECDILVLPKPLPEDLLEMREGQILWGWPHCVQDEKVTQNAIDRKLTLIAWEAMNYWRADGTFDLHVFHKNNELAGYCSLLHALQLVGATGQYGRRLRAAIISFGATARGAVAALAGQGVSDVTVLTQREPAQVTSPVHSVEVLQFEANEASDRLEVLSDGGRAPMSEVLAGHDIIVNCVLQDPEDPYIFLTNDDLDKLEPGTLIVDVSCDEGMGFEWARPTTFSDPMFVVGDRIHYYAVDHSPSYLWDSATWEISTALLAYLPTVMEGPDAWSEDETIQRAIEIRDGRILNPTILSFQNRSGDYPHDKKVSASPS